ncbi:MAG: NUDIX domain-containing protein [Spirochaetota bacterium]
MGEYKNPVPTVDIIIRVKTGKDGDGEGIVLISRKNPPYGWALPGGFVDYGESLEEAAVREAREETSLHVVLERQFHTYSDPVRDPRQHTITTVFIARAEGVPVGADDAKEAGVFTMDNIPKALVFDHNRIIDDYINKRY